MSRVPEVHVGVYLLALRHPVLVARQIAKIGEMWPGRLQFGVGVGGDDPHEYNVCGIDRSTRGARTDEALAALRGLLNGEALTYKSVFFNLDAARIVPAPEPPVPIVVGGRSGRALERAGTLGDGWLGLWVSPNRFADAVTSISQIAERGGREPVRWRHGMTVWCGFGGDRAHARAAVAASMEKLYDRPFEDFVKWTPYGTPAQVAEFLQRYIDLGCTSLTLVPCGKNPVDAMEGAIECARILRER